MAGTWNKYTDGSGKLVDTPTGRFVGMTWYHQGAHLWRVTWDGHLVKNGTGCIDGAEARREADAVIAACVRGETDPPWKQSRARQELEQRILDARARTKTPTPWGWVP